MLALSHSLLSIKEYIADVWQVVFERGKNMKSESFREGTVKPGDRKKGQSPALQMSQIWPRGF